MVTKLVRKRQDPNYGRGPVNTRVQSDRGPGLYYHRGDGYYSKYTEGLDGQLWHRRKSVKDVMKNERKYPHVADYKTRSKASRAKAPRISGGRTGYF